MKFKIIWSSFAEEQIDEIFEYYKTEASPKIAKNLTSNLIKSAEILSDNPYVGQVEELLIERAGKYRYLVYKNYKIIYSIDAENQFIKIADVFDTRQNPIKIERNTLR